MSKEYKLSIAIPAKELEQFLSQFKGFHSTRTSIQFIDNSPADSELALLWHDHLDVHPYQEAVSFLSEHRSVDAFRKENCTFCVYLVLDNLEQGNFEWSSAQLMALALHVDSLCLSVSSEGKDYVVLGNISS